MTGKAFGQQTPTQGEGSVSWQTWSNGAGGTPSISGDADWGKLKLDLTGAEGRSAVYDLGSASWQRFAIAENRYGSGQGTAVLLYRGSTASFTQDSADLAWNVYNGAVWGYWQYIQVRASTYYEDIVLDTFGVDIISYLPMKESL